MLDLFQEFQALIKLLNERNLPYALCGGVALAVYGIPRATVDIDFLVSSQAISDVKEAAESLGYQLETDLDGLAGGQVKLTRLTKFFAGAEDFLALDLIHGSGILEDVWNQRQKVQSDFGEIWVLPPAALITMKKLRGSMQDNADIERLREIADES